MGSLAYPKSIMLFLIYTFMQHHLLNLKKLYFKNNFVSKALNFALYKYIIKNANLSLFQFYLIRNNKQI